LIPIDDDTFSSLMRQAMAIGDDLSEARYVLARGYLDRQEGRKQTAGALASEKAAYARLRLAGVETSPEVAYYNTLLDAEEVSHG